MAERPVFIAEGQNSLVEQEDIMFQYYSGFSDAQKKRCIQSLHQAFWVKHPQWRVLEISSHSPEEIRVKLSAFHLPIQLKSGKKVSVECAFQADKVFQNGGPYLDLLEQVMADRKSFIRIVYEEEYAGDVIFQCGEKRSIVIE